MNVSGSSLVDRFYALEKHLQNIYRNYGNQFTLRCNSRDFKIFLNLIPYYVPDITICPLTSKNIKVVMKEKP